MKKFILGALLLLSSLSFTSCETTEEKLINEAEQTLINNLKDPSSYERIEAKIIDTITSTDWAADLVKNDKYYLEEEKESFKIVQDDPESSLYASMLKSVKDAESYLQRSNKILDSVKKSKEPNKIREILIEYKYRAKNSMGALDIEKTGIEYLPDPTMFSKSKGDKFHIYEIK